MLMQLLAHNNWIASPKVELYEVGKKKQMEKLW